MSYLRWAWSHKYVKGTSDDYIYDNGKEIVDYGNITNEGLVEILWSCIDDYYERDETLIKKYLKKKLSERLKVKLRTRPLSQRTIVNRMLKKSKDLEEKLK